MNVQVRQVRLPGRVQLEVAVLMYRPNSPSAGLLNNVSLPVVLYPTSHVQNETINEITARLPV